MKSAFSRLVLVSSLAATLLFFEGSHAYAATLYYDNNAGSGDSHWETLANWWQDVTHSSVASSLPNHGDTVYIDGSGVLAQLASNPLSLLQIVVGQFSGGSGAELYGVIGDAIFNGHSYNQGDIIGNAVFGDVSYNGSNGIVTGDAAFSGQTYNQGVVEGSATFDNESYNGSGGTVGADAAFTGQTYNQGQVGGDASFADVSYNGSGGTLGGDGTFSGHTYNEGTIEGSGSFSDTSYNGSNGQIGQDASFNDHTYNEGTIAGHATFSGSSYNGSDGSFGSSEHSNQVTGTLTAIVATPEPSAAAIAEAPAPAPRSSGSSASHRRANPFSTVGSTGSTAAPSTPVPVIASVSIPAGVTVAVSPFQALAFAARYKEIVRILDVLARFVQAPLIGQAGQTVSTAI